MIVGALVRRPVLADAGRVASKGRLTLLETIGRSAVICRSRLGPRSRLPEDVPFWLWIEGEQMFAVEKRDDLTIAWQRDDGISEEIPARHYVVRRSSGAEPLWGARTRDHIAGAPVTLVADPRHLCAHQGDHGRRRLRRHRLVQCQPARIVS